MWYLKGKVNNQEELSKVNSKDLILEPLGATATLKRYNAITDIRHNSETETLYTKYGTKLTATLFSLLKR